MELHPARNIDSLDGLRGFACLLVVLGHLAKEELIFDIKGIGQLGVMLFFVLSGFLMALLYTDQRLNAERLSVYAVRRVFRVVPAYVAVAVLSFLICQFYDNFGYHVDAHALVDLHQPGAGLGIAEDQHRRRPQGQADSLRAGGVIELGEYRDAFGGQGRFQPVDRCRGIERAVHRYQPIYLAHCAPPMG